MIKLKNLVLTSALLLSGAAMVARAQSDRMPTYKLPPKASKTDTVRHYFPDGQLQSVLVYSNDKLNGLQKEYNENGTRLAQMNCKDGQLHGRFTLYQYNGKLACHGEYQDGQLIELVKEVDGQTVYQEFPYVPAVIPEPVY